VRLTDKLGLLHDPQKHLDHLRVEQDAALLAEIVADLSLAPGSPVWTRAQQRIVNVDDRNDTRFQGDFFSR
jgi:hypothetical protein